MSNYVIIYTMNNQKTKLNLLILVLLFIIAFGTISLSVHIYALGAVHDVPLQNNEILYHYFESPQDIFVSSSEVLVADKNQVLFYDINAGRFNDSKLITSTNNKITQVVANDSHVFTLEETSFSSYVVIYALDNSSPYTLSPPVKFSKIAVTSTHLIGIKDDTLYSYDLSNYSLSTTILYDYTLNNIIYYNDLNGNEFVFVVENDLDSSNIHIYDPLNNTKHVALSLTATTIKYLLPMPAQNQIACVYADNIIYYTLSNKSLNYNNEFERNETALPAVDKLYSNSQSIYALKGYNVLRLTTNFASTQEIIASSSNALGFYNKPQDIVTRKGSIYVADTINNRVMIQNSNNMFILGNKDNIKLIQPRSLSVDFLGNIYVAYNNNHLATFDSEYKLTSNKDEKVIYDRTNNPNPNIDTYIQQLRVDHKSNLYIITRDNDLYIRENGETKFSYVASNIVSINCGLNTTSVYVAQKNSTTPSLVDIFELDITSTPITLNPTLIKFIDNFVDFAVDSDEKVYILKSNNLLGKLNLADGSIEYNYQTVDKAKGLTKIAISNITLKENNDDEDIDYRDIVILDTKAHRIRYIDASDYGVDISNEKVPPAFPSTAISNTDRIITTLIKDCDVYASASEIYYINSLPSGYKIIVPNYNKNSAYTLIVADDLNNDTYIIGYVYTQFIKSTFNYYTEAPVAQGKVWKDGGKIYTLPTRYAPSVTPSLTLFKDDIVDLSDFAYELSYDSIKYYGYIDNYQTNVLTWYKITYTSNNIKYEGYLPSYYISFYTPTPIETIKPQTNAEIISKDKSNPSIGAVVYFWNDSYDSPMPELSLLPLDVGKGVEVIGTFNSADRFTRIYYDLDDGAGTIDCWVESENIKYYGVNIFVIVMTIILSITAIIIILLLLNYYTSKKKKVNKV